MSLNNKSGNVYVKEEIRMTEQNLIPLHESIPCVNAPITLTEQELRDGWTLGRVGNWQIKVLKNERTRRILTGKKE